MQGLPGHSLLPCHRSPRNAPHLQERGSANFQVVHHRLQHLELPKCDVFRDIDEAESTRCQLQDLYQVCEHYHPQGVFIHTQNFVSTTLTVGSPPRRGLGGMLKKLRRGGEMTPEPDNSGWRILRQV